MYDNLAKYKNKRTQHAILYKLSTFNLVFLIYNIYLSQSQLTRMTGVALKDIVQKVSYEKKAQN